MPKNKNSVSQNMQNKARFDGAIETVETFCLISHKEKYKTFNLQCLAKYQGIPATKRGLLKEQVCIHYALNLNGPSIAKISNLDKPNIKTLEAVLNGKIEPSSIFVTDTDNLCPYNKISYEMNLNHIKIPKNKRTFGLYIQMINNYYNKLKSMLKHIFKGVATKYLNNYLIYHNFVNIVKDKNKEQFLFEFIQNTNCISKSINISKRSAVPMLVS